ncbi:MAG: PEGA domain-containing protein [Clostridiales bacterium]|jgi:hypothetical protein|nr:PEGA domain-containing protein [Clostridiales bacterium]
MDEREKTRKMDARDGVVYIPGGHRPPPGAGETRKIATGGLKEPKPVAPGPKIGRRPAAAKKPARMPAKRTNYAIILVTTVFVGVIAAVFVFATVLNSVLNDDGGGNNVVVNRPGANGGGGEVEQPPYATVPTAPGSIGLTGLIREIRTNRLDLYIFETSELRSFFVESSSNLRDRLGNLVTLPQFSIGDVVELSHAPSSNSIETAQLSAQVRSYRDITGVGVDDGMLIIGNGRYILGDAPVVRYRGEIAAISDLDPIDIVTVGIFQDRHVTAIDISRSHGEIFIPQNETILGGIVEVGTTVFMPLAAEEMRLRVPAGENRVVIRGDNIQPLIFDINVNRGATIALNFDDLAYMSGLLTVRTDIEDAILYIGDRWHPVNEELLLDFGRHSLVVEAPGFLPHEQEVEIGEEAVELTINLSPIVITRNVIIATTPPHVRVYIDDEFRGTTPLQIDLEVGRHSLTLERQGLIGTTTPINVTEATTTFSFMLTQDPAWPVFE